MLTILHKHTLSGSAQLPEFVSGLPGGFEESMMQSMMKGHPSLLVGEPAKALQRSLRDVIMRAFPDNAFRKGVIEDEFFETTTLGSVLRAPEKVLYDASFVPNVGQKSLTELRYMVATAFESLFPKEWAAAANRVEQAVSDAAVKEIPRTPQKKAPSFIEQLEQVHRHWALAPERVRTVTDFYPGAFADHNYLYEQEYYRLEGDRFYYICHTIPELLKTQAVLTIELGKTIDAQAYGARMNRLMGQISDRKNHGIVLVDSLVISDLMACSGRYRGLRPEQAEEQIALILGQLEAQSPDISAYVVNYQMNQISSAFLTEHKRLIIYSFGGYLVSEDRILLEHYRKKTLAVLRSGIPLADFIAQSRRAKS
jgi:hypothetical protein